MIKVGESLPSGTFRIWNDREMKDLTTEKMFSNRRVILFAVPGAFTPVCSITHLPSFLRNMPALKERNIDEVYCLSVNDAFVMRAWAKDLGVEDDITMLADGSADFTRAMGMDLDARGFGMGIRSHRYSMIVQNGVLKDLYLEENPGVCEQSSGDHILANL